MTFLEFRAELLNIVKNQKSGRVAKHISDFNEQLDKIYSSDVTERVLTYASVRYDSSVDKGYLSCIIYIFDSISKNTTEVWDEFLEFSADSAEVMLDILESELKNVAKGII